MSKKKSEKNVVDQSTVDSDFDTSYTTRQPLEVAKRVGRSLAGSIGENAFTELQVAYCARLLPKFKDDVIIRKNQNVLLYWQYGYYKSTILKVFAQTIPDHMGTVDVTSLTLEKLFGSVDMKKEHIIEPAFTNDVKFVVISELTSLLGQRDFMRQFVNHMNAVLENEKVSRQMLKLGRGSVDEVELVELGDRGVHYDSRRGELWYVPNVSVFAATRPLPNRYFTVLNASGFFSRFHVIQHRVSEVEAKKHLYRNYRLDQTALAELKQINLALTEIEVNSVTRPSEKLLEPVYDAISAVVKDELAERQDVSYSGIINPRVKDDVAREILGFCFLRMAGQNKYEKIKELEYTDEDVKFLLERPYHFVEFALNPIIAADFSRVSKVRKIDRVKATILIYLDDGVEKHIDEIARSLESIDVRAKSSQATVYNGLSELQSEGKIARSRQGFYRKRKAKDDSQDAQVQN